MYNDNLTKSIISLSDAEHDLEVYINEHSYLPDDILEQLIRCSFSITCEIDTLERIQKLMLRKYNGEPTLQ